MNNDSSPDQSTKKTDANATAQSTELTNLSASQLADLIQQRKVSSLEILEAHLERVKRYNPKINAVVTIKEKEAREKAIQADQALDKGENWGPLHGVPMTVKDTWDVKGMRTTNGVHWLKKNISQQNAVVVQRLIDAGAIINGKTNLPFASYDWQCNNRGLYPRCNNPWDLTKVPGGSSGGGAAAVAAGFTPLELGSDVAGSIRYPAHCCGVFGLRITEGLLPYEGHGNIPRSPYTMKHLVSQGPLARYPEDLKLFLKLFTQGHGPQEQLLKHNQNQHIPIAKARIAWTGDFGEDKICSETRQVLNRCLDTCKNTGTQVEEVEPPFPLEDAQQIWGIIQGFEYNAATPYLMRTKLSQWLIRLLGLPLLFGRGAFSRSVGKGATSSIPDYFEALYQREKIIKKLQEFFMKYDFWITPVAVSSAFTHCRTGAKVDVEGETRPYSSLASLYNCTTAAGAHPIAVLPAGLTRDGLPIGLQIHGRHYHDFQVVDFATQLARKIPQIGSPNLGN